MKILFFGDIFGRPGREAIKKILPTLSERYAPDFVIGNVENIAHGNGVTASTLQELDELGIFSAYTSGDHIWDRDDTKELLEKKNSILLRPLNDNGPGRGALVVSRGVQRLLVVNLLGWIFGIDAQGEATIKRKVENPFQVLKVLLETYTINSDEAEKEYVNGIFIDFHAEFTSEKRALGFFLDGSISALVGSHTHVPTNDAQILPKGTAYMSDVGMVGPFHSIIGLDPPSLLQEYMAESKNRKEVGMAKQVEVGAVLISLGNNGLAETITSIREIINLD